MLIQSGKALYSRRPAPSVEQGMRLKTPFFINYYAYSYLNGACLKKKGFGLISLDNILLPANNLHVYDEGDKSPLGSGERFQVCFNAEPSRILKVHIHGLLQL
jgi:hypothetical protein